jgi:hypothetical protein
VNVQFPALALTYITRRCQDQNNCDGLFECFITGQPDPVNHPQTQPLDLIIQKGAWVIVDIILNEAPVIAWTNFETKSRDNLHELTRCEIRFFHYAASMIHNRTLETIELILGEALEQELRKNKSDVPH